MPSIAWKLASWGESSTFQIWKLGVLPSMPWELFVLLRFVSFAAFVWLLCRGGCFSHAGYQYGSADLRVQRSTVTGAWMLAKRSVLQEGGIDFSNGTSSYSMQKLQHFWFLYFNPWWALGILAHFVGSSLPVEFDLKSLSVAVLRCVIITCFIAICLILFL